MKDSFKVGSLSVDKGKTALGRLECSELADGTPLTIPFVIVNGEKAGPTLLIQAACHGDEVTGTFICREVVANVDAKTLSGTLITIPIANVVAYLTRSRGFLNEERGPINMGTIFPGNKNGLLTERLAYVIERELISISNYVIDIHTGLSGALCYPFTYILPTDNLGTLEIREEMAKATGIPLVFQVSRERFATFGSFAAGYNRTFGGQCDKRGIPWIMIEMGEGGRITKEFVPIGVKAICNIMKYLKMIPSEPGLQVTKQRSFSDYNTVHANRGGLLFIEAPLGSQVRKGDLLAKVYGPLDVLENIIAPIDGVVLRIMTNAIIYPGAEAAWIAKVEI